MSKIVLTGATGLLGGRTVVLLKDRHELHAIVRKVPSEPVKDVTYHVRDLSHEWTTDGLPNEVDAVIHLAQSTCHRDFPKRAMEQFSVNVDATARLLDYAQESGARSFILASTGGIYGAHAEVITETTPEAISDGLLRYYFDSKRCAEILVQSYSSFMNVVVLRPFFIYGPGQKSNMLVPRLIKNIRSKCAIKLNGESGASMNPVYVDDAVKVLEESLRLEGSHTLNVGGPEVVTIRDMATMIAQLLDVDPEFEIESGKPDGFVADISRMRSLVGNDLTDFQTGIALVINQEMKQ